MYKFSHCTISGATPHILPSNGAPPLQKSLLLSTGQRQRTSHSAVSMRVTYISRNRPSPWHIAASEGNATAHPHTRRPTRKTVATRAALSFRSRAPNAHGHRPDRACAPPNRRERRAANYTPRAQRTRRRDTYPAGLMPSQKHRNTRSSLFLPAARWASCELRHLSAALWGLMIRKTRDVVGASAWRCDL